MDQVIDMYILTDGSVKIETSGFTGTACQDVTRQLEQALGVTVEDTVTSEYYNEEKQKVSQS